MAAGRSSLFSVRNFADEFTKDANNEEPSNGDDWLKKNRKMMTIKTALKASNDALANEQQKRVNDRRMYQTIINKITNYYKNKLQESRVLPWSQQSQPAQLAQQSRQSAQHPCVDQSVQTLQNCVADQAVQTEFFDEVSAVDRIYDEAAANVEGGSVPAEEEGGRVGVLKQQVPPLCI